MEQFILILIIGLISLINWVIQKSAEARERRKLEQQADRGEGIFAETEEEPVRRHAPVQEDREESMRRLMEALGLPGDAPEPRPAPRPQPRRAEPLFEAPPPLPGRERPPLTEVARMISPPPEPKPRVKKVESSYAIPTKQAAAPSQVRRILASPGGLRDAIVLSEILGPPKAFRIRGE